MQSRLRFLTFSVLLLALGAGDARAQGIDGVRPARAQAEIFGGYSYMRSTVAISGTPINVNGASFSTAFYLKDWLGLVGDVGVYHQGAVAASGDSLTVSSYQFGPRVRFRNDGDFTTFLQVLVGGGRAGGTLYTHPLGGNATPLGASGSFLFTVGGGVDWQRNPRIGLRVIQLEYLHSQFPNGGDNRQGNFRLSTGVVFTFGN